MSQTVIYHGADILTMEGEEPHYVECVAVKNGKIVYSGALEGAVGEKVDLGGGCLMPGFIDPHIHPSMAAVLLTTSFITPFDWNLPDRNVKGVRTPEEYLNGLNKLVAEKKDTEGWIITWGFHHYFHGTMSRKMLDTISPSVPLVVWHRSFHEMFFNTAALTSMEYEDEDELKNNHQVDWEKGHFFEKGMELLMNSSTLFMQILPKIEEGYRSAVAAIHAGGITTIADLEYPMFDEDLEYNMSNTVMKEDATRFSTFCVPSSRMYHAKTGSHASAIQEINKVANNLNNDKFVVFNNHVKIILDGAFFSQLMQMKDGYTDGHSGEWFTTPQMMEETMSVYWQEGFQVHVHTNGDLAMEAVLDNVEKLMKEKPRPDHRTTIEHAGFFTEDQAERLAKLGCLVSANPYYHYCLADRYSEFGLGVSRATAMCPLNWLVQHNVPLALHSDFTMAPAQPLLLAWAAANRKTVNGNVHRPELRISAYRALRGITRDAALILGQLDTLGTVTAGKIANFTLLKENPLMVDIDRIKDVEVLGTVYKGVYKGVLGTVYKGVLNKL